MNIEGEPTRLDELQQVIASSPEAIESEFGRTANTWLSCFGTRVFVVETYLYSKRVEELLPAEKYQEARVRLERLKERLHDLHEQYPSKEDIPPEETKQELLAALNVL